MVSEEIWQDGSREGERSLEALGAGKESVEKSQDSQFEAVQEHYGYYYGRILPLLERGLDFARIAGKTGLKERRIRETLLFRLKNHEVPQLQGRQDGFCYICGYKTYPASVREPVCLKCLRAVYAAIQEIYALSTKAEPYVLTLPEIGAPPPNSLLSIEGQESANAASPENEAVGSMVPLSEFQQALEELNRYRALYGPLPTGEKMPEPAFEMRVSPQEPEFLGPDTRLSEPDEISSENVSAFEEEEGADPFLQMLKLDDQEVQPAGLDMMMSPQRLIQGHLRHFGFERLKGCKG
ncbi:MAG TPA: hypothetical protein V6C99_10540 [Oculatellaceae cyanobacterium]|jgi:hypothetical protein